MWMARGPDTIPGGGLSEKLEPSLAVELRRHRMGYDVREGPLVQDLLLGPEPVFIDPLRVVTKGWSQLAGSWR